MANTTWFEQNDSGTPVKRKALDMGDGSFAGVVGRYAQTVAPTDQVTTASYVDVAGSTLDTLYSSTVSYTILNNGANSITWQVLAANLADFSDAQVVKAGAAVAASALDTYSASPAVYRYYKVQIKDTAGGSHGQSHIGGITKG